MYRGECRPSFPKGPQTFGQWREGQGRRQLDLEGLICRPAPELAEAPEGGSPISTSPGQNGEGIKVESLSNEVTNRGDVLAGVRPVGAGAAGRDTGRGGGQHGYAGFG